MKSNFLKKTARYIIAAVFFGIYLKISFHLGSFSPFSWPHENVGPLEIVSAEQGYSFLHIGTGIDGTTLWDEGVLPRNVIGTHADSVIKVRVKKKEGFIEGDCFYPEYVSRAKIRCFIENGSQFVFTSPTLSASQRKASFKVAVPNDGILTLLIAAVGSVDEAHGAWINLR